MDRDEMIRRFHTDPDTLSPEARARTDAADEHTERKIANGEFSARRTAGDDFAIGLDSNYEPFPVRERSDEDSSGEGGGKHRSDD